MSDILAPAGGPEQLLAALRCGADAVYLGAGDFNARRNATNFDAGALGLAVADCHEAGAKLYVTMNTLVLDGEWEALEETADLVARCGVDGVIVQDMGVLRLFVEKYPGLKRIASTQTAVHNVDGAKRLVDMGFDGLVLAREMTLPEMEAVRKAVDVHLEAFVHGAHCMSLSGACYLSGMLGGRSGNRGLCAQPCRLDWQCGGAHHVLSLKDMSLVEHLRALEAVGVDTFKIEGRMKRPEYVAAAVTACRKALAGEDYDLETLQAVFSRSGFSDGYLQGRRDGAMFGQRRKEDVTGAQGVLKGLAGLYHKPVARVPVTMQFTAAPGFSELHVSDGEHSVTVAGEVPQVALNRPMDAESAQKSLTKTGGTVYYTQDFRAEIAPGLMLPASALNAMRREALEALSQARRALRPHGAQPWTRRPAETRPRRQPVLWSRFARAGQVQGEEFLEKILLPVSEIGPEELAQYGEKLLAELPALCFPTGEAALAARLQGLKEQGLRGVMADNVYGLELARRLGLAVYGGFGLNITNTEALRRYEAEGLAAVTVSVEPSMAQLKALGGTLPRGLVAYGRLPLMRWRNCPLRAHGGCDTCGGEGKLTDRLGLEFPVECAGKAYSSLLNSLPLHIAEKDLTGFDFLLLYFTREEEGEVRSVLRDYLQRRPCAGRRTGGLYYRELL